MAKHRTPPARKKRAHHRRRHHDAPANAPRPMAVDLSFVLGFSPFNAWTKTIASGRR